MSNPGGAVLDPRVMRDYAAAGPARFDTDGVTSREVPIWDATTQQFLPGPIPPMGSGGARHVAANYVATATDNILLCDALGQAPPVNISIIDELGGGAFPLNAQAYWTVTAVDAAGHESVGPNTNAAHGFFTVANSSGLVQWNNPQTGQPDHFNIYRADDWLTSNPAVTPKLIGSVAGNVHQLLDTKLAQGTQTPPATNGAAFQVTLPDATNPGQGAICLVAISNTPNLVTVVPHAGQSIDGFTQVLLGLGAGALYRSVALIPDPNGSGVWRSFWSIPATLSEAHGVNVGYGINGIGNAGCPPNYNTPLVVIPVPLIGQGQGLSIKVTSQFKPQDGCYELTPSVNLCDQNGIIATNSTNSGDPYNSNPNIGYWVLDNIGDGDWLQWGAEWTYNPRPGDVNLLNTGGGSVSGLYIGFHLDPTGGTCFAASASLEITAGAIPVSYYPHP